MFSSFKQLKLIIFASSLVNQNRRYILAMLKLKGFSKAIST